MDWTSQAPAPGPDTSDPLPKLPEELQTMHWLICHAPEFSGQGSGERVDLEEER